MKGTCAEKSLIVEFETGEPERYVQFDPDGLP